MYPGLYCHPVYVFNPNFICSTWPGSPRSRWRRRPSPRRRQRWSPRRRRKTRKRHRKQKEKEEWSIAREILLMLLTAASGNRGTN
jgi:hypothetical protein